MHIETNVQTNQHVLEAVLTSVATGHTAFTGIHQRLHRHRLGGVRFVERGSVDELAHLAVGMTRKCRAANVPLDGMKALIVCPNGVPPSPEERAAILASHIREVIAHEPEVIYGPDMGCPEAVLDIVAERHGLGNHVTGLSRRCGGLDVDANGLTAFGLHVALTMLTAVRGKAVSVQGFGAVGAHLALWLSTAGARMVAVCNKAGTLVDPTSIDVPRLFRSWSLSGDDALPQAASLTPSTRFVPTPLELWTVKADIAVLAARTTVLSLERERQLLRRENPDVASIESFLHDSGVELIVEGANHPLSYAAEDFCESEGVVVLPDVLVNSGGMIGCWYEYQHRAQLLGDPAIYDVALAACRQLIVERVGQNCTAIGGRLAGASARPGRNSGSHDRRSIGTVADAAVGLPGQDT